MNNYCSRGVHNWRPDGYTMRCDCGAARYVGPPKGPDGKPGPPLRGVYKTFTFGGETHGR